MAAIAPSNPVAPVSRWLPVGLAAVAILARIPFVTHQPLAWDAVQFTLGVLHLNIALHEPHAPGYYVYIRLGQLLHLLGFTPYGALVAISVAAGGVMTGVLSWWAGKLAGRTAALATGLLCMVSPLAWWMSGIGLTYGPSGCFSALVGYACWRLYTRPGERVWWAALALGVAGGFRPQDAILLFPLWLYCVTRQGRKPALAALLLFAALTATWLTSLLLSHAGLFAGGGAHAPNGAVVAYAKGVWSFIPIGGHWSWLRQNVTYFGLSAPMMLMVAWFFVPFARGTELTRRSTFLLLWLAPGAGFFLLRHMGGMGYNMLLFPGAALLAGVGVARLARRLEPAQTAMFFVVVAGLMAFFTYQTVYLDQRHTEHDMAELAAACRPYAGPESLLLSTTSVNELKPEQERPVLVYRYAMWLVPEIQVLRFPLEGSAAAGGPNQGYHLQSAVVAVPYRVTGIRHLLLTDEVLLADLPPGAPARQLARNFLGVVYEVELDPSVPVIVGPGEKLQMKPAG